MGSVRCRTRQGQLGLIGLDQTQVCLRNARRFSLAVTLPLSPLDSPHTFALRLTQGGNLCLREINCMTIMIELLPFTLSECAQMPISPITGNPNLRRFPSCHLRIFPGLCPQRRLAGVLQGLAQVGMRFVPELRKDGTHAAVRVEHQHVRQQETARDESDFPR